MRCSSFPKTEPRQKLLAALFTKARDMGIESDELRENIAPGVIRKRLSEATTQEIFRVLDHLTKLYTRKEYKNYESSKAGLLNELLDAARARWGQDFEKPLRVFINSHGFKGTVTHFKFMKVTELKAFKTRILELNRQDGICPTR